MTVDKIVTWVILLSIVDWVEFHDSDSASDLEDSGSTSCIMWKLSIFDTRNCVPISCMCKKQTSASHSSTESEIIALDAAVRMDGALDLWDVVIEMLHSSNHMKPSTKESSWNRSGFNEAADNSLRMSNAKLYRKITRMLINCQI